MPKSKTMTVADAIVALRTLPIDFPITCNVQIRWAVRQIPKGKFQPKGICVGLTDELKAMPVGHTQIIYARPESIGTIARRHGISITYHQTPKGVMVTRKS